MCIRDRYVRRPLALLTIKKAVERLPVEVLPNGIVQVQQSTTVRDKLRAEKEARQSVANSLEQDAAAYLDILQDIIRELDAQSETVDYYLSLIHIFSGFIHIDQDTKTHNNGCDKPVAYFSIYRVKGIYRFSERPQIEKKGGAK